MHASDITKAKVQNKLQLVDNTQIIMKRHEKNCWSRLKSNIWQNQLTWLNIFKTIKKKNNYNIKPFALWKRMILWMEKVEQATKLKKKCPGSPNWWKRLWLGPKFPASWPRNMTFQGTVTPYKWEMYARWVRRLVSANRSYAFLNEKCQLKWWKIIKRRGWKP